MSYKAIVACIFSLSISTIINASEIVFRGNMLSVIEEIPERNTGLDKIYVIYDTKDVDLCYTPDDISTLKFYKYSNLGGGFAEEVNNVDIEDNLAVIKNIEGNCGYIVEDSGNRYYFWLVNYLPLRYHINSVGASADSECDATLLDVDGFAPPIHYYTINGQQRVLSRDISVTYDTQEWDNEKREYIIKNSETNLDYLTERVRIVPPSYCHTAFKFSGDKFLRAWRWEESYESIVIPPSAVNAVTFAEQKHNNSGSIDASARMSGFNRRTNKNRFEISRADDDITSGEDNQDESQNKPDASNQIKDDDSNLGGSAPADISFIAYTTEGVLHHEWQLSSDPEFEEIDNRFNQQTLDYTFLDEGTYYMRYIGSNSDGSCDVVGDTYTIVIGASEILCPNAFSPDGDGVNDKWKISYRSIIDFDCWIFDRYGAELYHFSDPEDGWDGTRNGKAVKGGVYYYVITATGADGKKYKKSGDINILRRRNLDNNPSEE